MAVLKNKDGKELYIDCCCGCNEGIRFKIDKDDWDYYCFMTYTNGSFYREQGDTLWYVLYKKLKKIWAIIRNKDFYYAEVTMTKAEFNEFREYITSIE
jgi:hypothetical protein